MVDYFLTKQDHKYTGIYQWVDYTLQFSYNVPYILENFNGK